MKNAVMITGATVNTGFGIAQKMLSEGRVTVITSRRQESVDEAVAKLKAQFPAGEVIGYKLDMVSPGNNVNEAEIDAVFADLDKQGIVVDALVLNAANLGIRQEIFKNPLSDFNNVIQTNVVANYCLVEHAAKRIIDAKIPGSVVFINSNTSYRAIPNRIAYSASKGAQLGMMRALALDLGKYNIRVNAVLPGMIKTDRWENNYNDCRHALSCYPPLGKAADFSDIAEAAWYFIAHAPFTTGAELTVDGGNMIQLYPLIDENR